VRRRLRWSPAAPLGVAADRQHVQQRRLLARQSSSADPLATGPLSVAYAPSKAFLNAVTIQYAKELRDTNILINAACPGFVATDLNNFRGHRTPEQGAAIAIRLATLPADGPTGGFFEDEGPVPW
jgi:NAD(P)-dependent dehydrogenase (short-subunit alcohol dehydrogenase family)